ncbi:MAG: GDP-L-fucose synthase [Chloroflexi bacterium]|nr:GDP-L-fucose synthase [Chloroflexota bacterium]MCH8338286.1 GDP-L-fucose synthase [Chloroflexota bacterium]
MSGNGSFWADKRICVTGGAGFLGSHVIDRLKKAGATDIFVPRKSEYDLVDGGAVRNMLEAARPQIVLHLAANGGGIGANQAHQAEFFYDNIMMGVQLLHESWRNGVEKFVAVGTVCSYPKFTPVPFKEVDFWGGYPEETNAPYGLAKKMLLVQGQAYRQQYEFNSVYLVPVNLYGPRDDFDLENSHVIAAVIRKCIEAIQRGDKQIVVWGDGSPTREFLYAADAADGIVLGAEKYAGDELVNLGSGQEISIKELVETVVELTGYEGEIVWDTSRPNGQPRRSLDTSRARERFGFVASTPLRDGLQSTIAWYRQQVENGGAAS